MADRRCADQHRRLLRSLNADDTLGAAAPSDAPGTPVAASGHSPHWPSGGTHCTRRLRAQNHNRSAKACKISRRQFRVLIGLAPSKRRNVSLAEQSSVFRASQWAPIVHSNIYLILLSWRSCGNRSVIHRVSAGGRVCQSLDASVALSPIRAVRSQGQMVRLPKGRAANARGATPAMAACRSSPNSAPSSRLRTGSYRGLHPRPALWRED
jgi:hypothetical protein